VILGGGVAVCLLLSVHRAVIFTIAQLSCYIWTPFLRTVHIKDISLLTSSQLTSIHLNWLAVRGESVRQTSPCHKPSLDSMSGFTCRAAWLTAFWMVAATANWVTA